MKPLAPCVTALAALSCWTCYGIANADPATATIFLTEASGISISTPPTGSPMVAGFAGQIWRLDGAGSAVPLTSPQGYADRPQISPDGRQVAYHTLRDGFLHIAVLDLEGGEPRLLTSGNFNDSTPAWTPDGQHVVLVSDRGGNSAIWDLAPDSLTLRQLTVEPGDALDPAWDSTGHRLAYVAERGGAASGLYVRDDSGSRLIVRGTGLRAPSWRPDGSVIAFVAQGDAGPQLKMVILSDPPVVKPVTQREVAFPVPAVWSGRDQILYTADGRIKRRDFGSLQSSEAPFSATLSVATSASQPQRTAASSPVAKQIRGLRGVAALPNGNVVVSALGDLWELTGEGTLLRQLTNDAYVDEDPVVSPDGQRLAFTSDRGGGRQIWLMDLASGACRRLSGDRDPAMRASWSPDGERIAYLAMPDAAGGSLALRAANFDQRSAGAANFLTLATGITTSGTPAWSPDGAQVAVIAPPQTGERKASLARLLIYAADGSGGVRQVTVVDEAVGPGPNYLSWSRDGRSIAIGSRAGIALLPVSPEGLVGADWHQVTSAAAESLQWSADQQTLWFIGNEGLSHVPAAGGPVTIVAVPLTIPSPASVDRLVIRAGRVFDGNNAEYQYNQDIVIDGGRIVAVRPWDDSEPAEKVLDARDKTIMPGLIDTALRSEGYSPARLGRTLVAFGITTAQWVTAETGALRETSEIWQTHQAGPRLLGQRELCGSRDPSTGSADPDIATLRICAPLLLSRSQAETPAELGLPVWSSHWLAARHGGVAAIEPGAADSAVQKSDLPDGFPRYQDGIDLLARSGTTLIPALVSEGFAQAMADRPALLDSATSRALYSPAELDQLATAGRLALEQRGPYLRRWLRDRQRASVRLIAAGGHVAAASGLTRAPPGLSLHAELQLLAGAGLSPAQVLRMATSEAARVLGIGELTGTIAPGRRADLLVINGDPLSHLEDVLALDAVVLEGRVQRTRDYLAVAAAELENFTGRPPPEPGESNRSIPIGQPGPRGVEGRSGQTSGKTGAHTARAAGRTARANPTKRSRRDRRIPSEILTK